MVADDDPWVGPLRIGTRGDTFGLSAIAERGAARILLSCNAWPDFLRPGNGHGNRLIRFSGSVAIEVVCRRSDGRGAGFRMVSCDESVPHPAFELKGRKEFRRKTAGGLVIAPRLLSIIRGGRMLTPLCSRSTRRRLWVLTALKSSHTRPMRRLRITIPTFVRIATKAPVLRSRGPPNGSRLFKEAMSHRPCANFENCVGSSESYFAEVQRYPSSLQSPAIQFMPKSVFWGFVDW
jgi:hypothetical protein